MHKFVNVLLLSASLYFSNLFAGEFIQPDNLYPQVKFITSHGDIVVELNRSKAPLTVNNFLSYVKNKTYNETIFHRLEPEFVLQGGGYDIKNQPIKGQKAIVNESGNGLKNLEGTIAMARDSYPHSASTHFYFNLKDSPHLDPGMNWGYTVFGHIVEGQDTIEKIRAIPTEASVELGLPNVPTEKITIKRVIILDELKNSL